MNKIIDAHAHIKIDVNYKDNYEKLLVTMKESNIDKAIVSIDPYIDQISCFRSDKHYTYVTNNYKNSDNLLAICENCGEVRYDGEDPYKEYNEKFFSIDNDNIYKFLMLSVTNNTINSTIEQSIEKFGNSIKGLKLYTGLSNLTLNQISIQKFNLPLLIHTGIQENQNPINMIEFLKRYDGNIILAHYARFEKNILQLVKNSDNIFIDTSPTYYLYRKYIYENKKGGLFDKSKLYRPIDFYYKIIDEIGIEKIVFGTDYPFSDMKKEVSVLNDLDLTSDEYEMLTSKNITKILRR